MIGIIGALESEIDFIKNNMLINKKYNLASKNFYSGSISGKEIILGICGIGKVNAAICTQIMIDYFKAEYIINVGTAGAADDNIQIGDIIISSDAIQYDIDVTALGFNLGQLPYMEQYIFESNSLLIQKAIDIAKKSNVSYIIGRVTSGDKFISSNFLHSIKELKPSCFEMEGAAIAQVANLNSIPFVIIRGITDNSNQDANVDYAQNKIDVGLKSAKLAFDLVKSFDLK